MHRVVFDEAEGGGGVVVSLPATKGKGCGHSFGGVVGAHALPAFRDVVSCLNVG